MMSPQSIPFLAFCEHCKSIPNVFLPRTTGWRKCTGCLIFAGHFPQRRPILSGQYSVGLLRKETCNFRHLMHLYHPVDHEGAAYSPRCITACTLKFNVGSPQILHRPVESPFSLNCSVSFATESYRNSNVGRLQTWYRHTVSPFSKLLGLFREILSRPTVTRFPFFCKSALQV